MWSAFLRHHIFFFFSFFCFRMIYFFAVAWLNVKCKGVWVTGVGIVCSGVGVTDTEKRSASLQEWDQLSCWNPGNSGEPLFFGFVAGNELLSVCFHCEVCNRRSKRACRSKMKWPSSKKNRINIKFHPKNRPSQDVLSLTISWALKILVQGREQ